MPDIRYIDTDFVRFDFQGRDGVAQHATLVFGDKVEVLHEGGGERRSQVRALELFDGTLEGSVRGAPFRGRERGVLRFSMVDVQQGDGMILETPPDENHDRRIVFIDSGDNQLFARHAAARYQHRNSSALNPLDIDLILITHGDADHFDGLNDIRRSETDPGIAARKRLFIRPRRVYHNGLVKAPSARPLLERLGRTVVRNGTPFIVDLYDDPRGAPTGAQNTPFRRWGESLTHWEERGPITIRRVACGMSANRLFGFLGSGINVDIQGPFTSRVTDPQTGKRRHALPFLHKPPQSALLHLEDGTEPLSEAFSDSHTINGHSIALRLTYGNVRFSLTGDLNQESMSLMRRRIDLAQLESEIIKAPHHGAADFDFSALQAMKPVVSLISSGDESAGKEYIHPRATLVSALGKVSRGETGIVLCTELAAFFSKRSYSHQRPLIAKYYQDDEPITRADLRKFYGSGRRSVADEKALPSFFAFERTNFGIIHIRTDGERVLVFTHSGKEGMREAYRFTVDQEHQVQFAKAVTTG
jgi:beta-lactamase superfamily II metal-dependent hydrolase